MSLTYQPWTLAETQHLTADSELGDCVTAVYLDGRRVDFPVFEANILEGWIIIWDRGKGQSEKCRLDGAVEIDLTLDHFAKVYDLETKRTQSFGEGASVRINRNGIFETPCFRGAV